MKKKISITESLKKIEIIASLNDEELRDIMHNIRIKTFNKNEIILIQEDINNYMFMVLDGEVKVTQTTEAGKEIILAMYHGGEFFGEMSLIDGMTVSATVTANKDCLIAILSKNDFYSLLYSQKKVLENLLKIFCSRIRSANETILLLNYNNASQRIKLLFLMLSKKYGKEEKDGTVLHIKLTHQEIANMTGMIRETVTKVIDKWKSDNEITVLKNRFIKLNQKFFKNI